MAHYRRIGPGQTRDTPPKDRTGPWEVKVRHPVTRQQVTRRLDERTGQPFRGQRHAREFETWLVNALSAPAHASSPTATLREFSRHRWWPQHVMVNIPRKETRDNFALHLRKRILPTLVTYGDQRVPLGDVPIGDIRVSMVDEWMAELAIAGDQPPTRNRARTVLSSILGRAVKADVIPANPCTGADRAKHTKKARRYLTVDEVLRIANEMRNLRDRTMVIVQAFTGLRPSELLGLTLENVHLDEARIYVGWQLAAEETTGTKRDGNRKVIRPAWLDTPKDYQTAYVELPGLVVDTLREYLDSDPPHAVILTDGGDAQRLVFAKPDGKPIKLRTWHRSNLSPAVIRAGLGRPVLDASGEPVMTRHVPGRAKPKPVVRCLVSSQDFRHFFASFCRSLPDGLGTPDYVCARMRHHDPAYTMKEYGDLWAAPAAPVIAAMDAVLAAATA